MAKGQSPEFLRKIRRKYKLGEFRPKRAQRSKTGPPARRSGRAPRPRLQRSRKAPKASGFGFSY